MGIASKIGGMLNLPESIEIEIGIAYPMRGKARQILTNAGYTVIR